MHQKILVICLFVMITSCSTAKKSSQEERYKGLRDCICHWLDSQQDARLANLSSELGNAPIVVGGGIVSFGNWSYFEDQNVMIRSLHPARDVGYEERFNVICITGVWSITKHTRMEIFKRGARPQFDTASQ